MGSVLVFDIETIPDLIAVRKLYNLDHSLSDIEVAAAISALRKEKTGSTFMPHYLQKIVAISLVLQHQGNLKVWSIGELDSSEAELIQRFFAGIDKYTPTLVSWNGTGFDLPVLQYRALLNNVIAPKYWEIGNNENEFRWNNYLNRFHYRHLDLMDVLSSYQAKAYAPLDEIATLLGFPGKMGMSGSKVLDYYLEGKLSEIRAYCETDVLNTYGVYLNFEKMRGVLSVSQYNEAMQNLKNLLLEKSQEAHLQEFLSAWSWIVE